MNSLFGYLIPNGPVTRAVRRKLRQLGLRYKMGYLGMLMDENYIEVLERNQLLYRADHLKKLARVDQNPEVVDIAFEVLEEMLQEKKVAMPTKNMGMPPYRPNLLSIALYYLLNAALMTILITLIVVFVKSIAWMTTLIVIVSIGGAMIFIWSLFQAVTYVDID